MTDRVQQWSKARVESIGTADPHDIVEQIDRWAVQTVNLDADPTQPSLARLMDYGCGVGRVARPLAVRGYRMTLVDANPAYLNQAIQTDSQMLAAALERAVLVSGDLTEQLPTVDVAYSTDVFIHFTWEYAARALAHMASAVRPGGLVLVQVPIYEEPAEGDGWIDVTTYGQLQFVTMALAAGLTPVEVYGNAGRFGFDRIGPNHNQLQVLRRIRADAPPSWMRYHVTAAL